MTVIDCAKTVTDFDNEETEPSVVQGSLLRRLSRAINSLLVLRGVDGLLPFR